MGNGLHQRRLRWRHQAACTSQPTSVLGNSREDAVRETTGCMEHSGVEHSIRNLGPSASTGRPAAHFGGVMPYTRGKSDRHQLRHSTGVWEPPHDGQTLPTDDLHTPATRKTCNQATWIRRRGRQDDFLHATILNQARCDGHLPRLTRTDSSPRSASSMRRNPRAISRAVLPRSPAGNLELKDRGEILRQQQLLRYLPVAKHTTRW
jgi:hypothetical protein